MVDNYENQAPHLINFFNVVKFGLYYVLSFSYNSEVRIVFTSETDAATMYLNLPRIYWYASPRYYVVAIRSRRSSDACAVGITIRARRRASKYIVEPEDLVKPLVEFVGVAVVLDGVNPVEEVNPVEDVVNVGVV